MRDSDVDEDQPAFVRMTPYERAVGWLAGIDTSDQWARSRRPKTARTALRTHFSSLLRTGRPVYIAFSGGVDSSLLLAVASEAARMDGIEPPVPITVVYKSDALASETEWQRLVLQHLGLEDGWQRILLPPEQDLVGPAALDILRHTGVCWPAAYLVNFRATCAAAPDGAFLITGDGGDEALGTRRVTALARAVHLRRLSRPVTRSVIKALAPRDLRYRAERRASAEFYKSREWLQLPARERNAADTVADNVAEPLNYARSTYHWANRRAATVGRHNMACLAREHGVEVDLPLWSHAFSAALASDAGTFGWLSRSDCVAHIAGDLLPRAVVGRRDKAVFNTVIFGPSAREIAREWDGEGLDPSLVDAHRLRQEWLRDVPHGSTIALLQEVALMVRPLQ